MKFSIIIPIYKVEQYLHECVDSVLNQTFRDFEVILVDDGSPDSCPLICDEYAQKDKRVKVIHKPNGGLADARNAGLDVAEGDYICFIDSDDYLINNHVLSLLADKTQTNPDVVHYKFIEWYERDGHLGKCNFDYRVETEGRTVAEIYCELIDKDAYYNSAWSKIIKRNLLHENNIQFEKGILGEDNEWYYHVVMVAKSLMLVDEPLYVYRRRGNSITTSITEKNLRDQLYVLAKWERLLQNKGADARAKAVWGSLAKQYCSAVILYSNLMNVETFYPELKRMAYMLNVSRNKRVVVFRWIRRFAGLKGLVALLQFYKNRKIG